MLHVTAAMLREMHLSCVDRRMTVHMYVLRKTDKCGSVTQPCTLHRNTVCVWDYRWKRLSLQDSSCEDLSLYTCNAVANAEEVKPWSDKG